MSHLQTFLPDRLVCPIVVTDLCDSLMFIFEVNGWQMESDGLLRSSGSEFIREGARPEMKHCLTQRFRE